MVSAPGAANGRGHASRVTGRGSEVARETPRVRPYGLRAVAPAASARRPGRARRDRIPISRVMRPGGSGARPGVIRRSLGPNPRAFPSDISARPGDDQPMAAGRRPPVKPRRQECTTGKAQALRTYRRLPARMPARRYRHERGPHSRDPGCAPGGRDRSPPQDTDRLFLLVVAGQRRPGCLGPGGRPGRQAHACEHAH